MARKWAANEVHLIETALMRSLAMQRNRYDDVGGQAIRLS
jgi:hypothetical protein